MRMCNKHLQSVDHRWATENLGNLPAKTQRQTDRRRRASGERMSGPALPQSLSRFLSRASSFWSRQTSDDGPSQPDHLNGEYFEEAVNPAGETLEGSTAEDAEARYLPFLRIGILRVPGRTHNVLYNEYYWLNRVEILRTTIQR